MKMKMSVLGIALLPLLLVNVVLAQPGVFDVTKFGAVPNGEISQALLSAWKEACASPTPSKIVIPKATFGLNEITFGGPCKAPVEIQVQGTLTAPADPKVFKSECWVTFQYVDFLTLTGGGTFDGQGATAWKQNDCGQNANCARLAMNLKFNFLKHVSIHDVTSKDSKNFHVNVLGCTNITFQHFTINAPETSINTDGIHVGRSTGVNILDSDIKTGDDCVSIGDGSKKVHVERVTCGPGHGFSVGSLGRYPKEEDVVGIVVKSCTLTNTMNGVRIKTWPASPAVGVASDMHFEDITMNNVGNPVLIDQEYCPYNQCTLSVPSKVKISNVSFKKIKGTSSTQLAVKLVCSKQFPCANVELGDIDLTYSGPQGPINTLCTNIQPTLTGKQNPAICDPATAPKTAAPATP